MRKYLWIASVLAALYGCGETPICADQCRPAIFETPTPEESPAAVCVTLSVRPSRQTQIAAISRMLSEDAICDVNLYLFDSENFRPVVHVHSAGGALSFKCPPGRYELFAFANAGRDLGTSSYDEILAYEVPTPETSATVLPMAQRCHISIPNSEQPVALAPVEVERCVTKISYRICVASEKSNIHVRSIQALNLPQRVLFFKAGQPATEYADAEIVPHTLTEGTMDGSFYMLPNLQGDVPEITAQTQKCPANAPPQATCLRIRATRDTKVLDYYVYLGRNNTSNFDVCANTQYSLDITIRGDNESDVRVQSYTVTVECMPQIALSDGFLLERTPLMLTLRLAGAYLDAGLRATLELKSGNRRYFRINGETILQEYPLSLSGAENKYDIHYHPPAFTRADCRFEFTVHLRDKYGEVASHDFSFCYAHSARVYTKWFDGMQGDGIVSSEDALGCVEHMTLSSIYYMVYFPDEGCTLVATPDENRKFEGWSRTHDHTGEVNYDLLYHLDPFHDPDTIYAYFR